MKKSPAKVIELFIYALLVILAIVFAMTHGGLYKPVSLLPTTMPTAAIESGTPTEENLNPSLDAVTDRPIYNLPPSGEFSPRKDLAGVSD